MAGRIHIRTPFPSVHHTAVKFRVSRSRLRQLGISSDPTRETEKDSSAFVAHFTKELAISPGVARGFFNELQVVSEKELRRTGEFTVPGIVKLVVQGRKARMGRNPFTGDPTKVSSRSVVRARVAKRLKDAVLPRK